MGVRFCVVGLVSLGGSGVGGFSVTATELPRWEVASKPGTVVFGPLVRTFLALCAAVVSLFADSHQDELAHDGVRFIL